MREVPSPDGPQADLILIEPNGDEHQVRCLCRKGGTTEISEEVTAGAVAYLNDRYGEQTVWALCRVTVLNSGL